MLPEFERYAEDYAELIRDPIRDRFAPDSSFFAERKLILIRDFYRRFGKSTRTAGWVDVGCGMGELLRRGKEHFALVSGCDPSARMLQRCKGLDVYLQESSARLPFPSCAFDLVTAVCIYHHVEPPLRQHLTREIVRILKPEGIFCMIEHNPFNPATRLIVRRTPVDAGAQLLTAAGARNIMRAAGMQVVETRYFLYFPERLYARCARFEGALSHVPLGGQFAVFSQKL